MVHGMNASDVALLVLGSSLALTPACGGQAATDAGAEEIDANLAVDASAALDVRVDIDVGARLPVTHGTRYCELLIAYLEGGTIRAEVWGTQSLNECPAALWEAIDTDSVRRERGATFVARNGPRYWLPDRTMASIPDRDPALFGDLWMQQLASVEVSSGVTASQPYLERTVLRDSSLEYDAGREVYELVAPDGAVYVMQSYAQIEDPSLLEADLPTLATRLALPAGWAYRARTLDATLIVSTPGMATVLQDDLQNSYSRRLPGG